MSKHEYFYLVAGLPDLAITDTHLPFSARTFLDELKNKIDAKDFQLVCILYYARDNRNLLNILFNKNSAKQENGCYSIHELQKGAEGNFILPHYMNEFITLFKENKNRFDEAEWEAKLTELYFMKVMKTRNRFLNQWMEFELNLKNILLAISNRRRKYPFSQIIIEANEIAALIKENPSTDFSTQPSLDFINHAINIIETENLIEREKKIDLLRWKKLEEMTFFNYFTIEAIIGFIIKLMIIEKWTILEQGEVKNILPAMLLAFKEKIKKPVAEN